MPHPAILGLATGNPEHRHNQTDLHDRHLAQYINSRRSRAIFTAAEIDTRHSVLPAPDFLADEPGTQARNHLYLREARRLAAPVINRALARAGLSPAEVDHFIVVSCTGLDTPGLDVLLAADLHMRPDVRRSGLVGMGCHAGLTGLDRAMLEVAARPAGRVLLLAVEFGTLHFQHGSKLDDMVAGAIFGDGLAAAVIGTAPESGEFAGFRLLDTATHSDYTKQGLMGFHLSDTGFQIHLSTKVAKTLKQLAPQIVPQFLARAGLSAEDVKFWGIHPGGARIVDAVGAALGLPPEALQFSRNVLRQYGNMSSATIFFVLDEIIRRGAPQPGDWALLLAFGPGLTIELALARWR